MSFQTDLNYLRACPFKIIPNLNVLLYKFYLYSSDFKYILHKVCQHPNPAKNIPPNHISVPQHKLDESSLSSENICFAHSRHIHVSTHKHI